jgi:hypothetical protein
MAAARRNGRRRRRRRVEGAKMDGPKQLPEIDFVDVGPRVGERFPDVVLPDHLGRVFDLHHVRAGRRALVVFFRSAGW